MTSLQRATALLLLSGCTSPEGPVEPFVAVTFNTGTTTGLDHDAEPDDGYTSATATLSDTHYGNGLAWPPAIDAARDWLADRQPAVVGVQEIFSTTDCAEVPDHPDEDLICADWQPGDPTVIERILPDHTIACHQGFADKCLAIHPDFGTTDDCPGGLCLDALDGDVLEGCSSGARVAWTDVTRPDGTVVRVANVHGSSGVSPDDQACRVRQLEYLRSYLLEGPALVVGDFNTDPGRFTFDESAQVLAGFPDVGLAFATEVGEDAVRSYQGLATIDHVLVRGFDGDCVVAGFTEGEPAVLDAVYFDHAPVACTLVPSD